MCIQTNCSQLRSIGTYSELSDYYQASRYRTRTFNKYPRFVILNQLAFPNAWYQMPQNFHLNEFNQRITQLARQTFLLTAYPHSYFEHGNLFAFLSQLTSVVAQQTNPSLAHSHTASSLAKYLSYCSKSPCSAPQIPLPFLHQTLYCTVPSQHLHYFVILQKERCGDRQSEIRGAYENHMGPGFRDRSTKLWIGSCLHCLCSSCSAMVTNQGQQQHVTYHLRTYKILNILQYYFIKTVRSLSFIT